MPSVTIAIRTSRQASRQAGCTTTPNVPGWNAYVEEKHKHSRNAYLYWISCNKPRYSDAFDAMKKTRAEFKLAYRYCKEHEDYLIYLMNNENIFYFFPSIK